MFTAALPGFEGPVEALLALVERGALPVADLPLALLVTEYLAYRIEADAAETAEFVGMAGRLLLLKSRALLPRPPAPEPPEDDPADLAAALAEYVRFKEVAALLREREEEGFRSYLRLAPPPAVPTGAGLTDITLDRLAAALRDVLARRPPPPPGPPPRETVTLRQKLADLAAQLKDRGRVSFAAFVGGGRTRLELIVAFMAVLELIRRGAALAEQPEPFGEIELVAVPDGLPAASGA